MPSTRTISTAIFGAGAAPASGSGAAGPVAVGDPNAAARQELTEIVDAIFNLKAAAKKIPAAKEKALATYMKAALAASRGTAADLAALANAEKAYQTEIQNLEAQEAAARVAGQRLEARTDELEKSHKAVAISLYQARKAALEKEKADKIPDTAALDEMIEYLSGELEKLSADKAAGAKKAAAPAAKGKKNP
jgi:chromosome segregation ATPase